MPLLAISLLSAFILGACAQSPAENHRPIVFSIAASPESIGPADSTTVTLLATDPDGDLLVYDWFTDSRLEISGTRAGQNWLYTTSSHSHVFYPGPGSPGTLDTAWVQAVARDGRGMSDNRLVYIKVQH